MLLRFYVRRAIPARGSSRSLEPLEFHISMRPTSPAADPSIPARVLRSARPSGTRVAVGPVEIGGPALLGGARAPAGGGAAPTQSPPGGVGAAGGGLLWGGGVPPRAPPRPPPGWRPGPVRGRAPPRPRAPPRSWRRPGRTC